MTLRDNTPEDLLKFAFAFIVIAIICLCISGCTHSKQVIKTVETVDSSMVDLYKDSLRLSKEETAFWQAKYKESEYNEVTFDSSRCPPTVINIDARCNVDSLKSELESVYTNKVKVLANGTKEYSGRIAGFKFKSEKDALFISTLQKTIDSLREVKQEVKTEYVKVTEYKDKKVKTQVLNFWWLFICGLVAGCFLGYRFKGPLSILFNHKK